MGIGTGMAVAFDMTISLTAVVQTVMIAGGGIAAIVTLRNTVTNLNDKMIASKKETQDQFVVIQSEIRKIGDVLINQADQNRRIIHLEEDVRELRHGNGFIRGPHGIDREYSG